MPKLGASPTHAHSVPVRITIWANLEASHVHVWIVFTVTDDSGHDDPHQQLGPQRQHIRNQISVISSELKALLPSTSTAPTHVRHALSALRVQTLHVICRVILAIHGPPQRRMPAQAHLVIDYTGLVVICADEQLAELVRSLRPIHLHPRRHPRQMLHGALQFLAFICPLHRSRSHLASDG